MSTSAQRFVCVPVDMIGHDQLSPLAIVVFVAIAQHANQSGRCWPSIGRLASMVRHTDRSVRRAIAQLIHTGYLERTARTDDVTGEQRSNVYTVKRVRVLFEADAVERPTTNDEPWHDAPGTLTPVSPPPDTRVTPPTDTRVSSPLTPVSGRTRTSRTRSTLKISGDAQTARPGTESAAATPEKPHPIRDLLTLHESLFLTATGQKSPPVTGQDVGVVNRLLKRYTHTELADYLRAFFASSDPFIRDSGWTIGAFSACLGKVIAQAHTSRLSPRTVRTLRAAQEFVDGH